MKFSSAFLLSLAALVAAQEPTITATQSRAMRTLSGTLGYTAQTALPTGSRGGNGGGRNATQTTGGGRGNGTSTGARPTATAGAAALMLGVQGGVLLGSVVGLGVLLVAL